MAEPVKIELSGEMNPNVEKKGFQKYVTDAELILQQIKGGAGLSLITGILSTRRPWTLFFTSDNYKVPVSVPRLTRRFYRNISHFQANYLFIFLGLFAYCLITTPLLLIAIVASFFAGRKLTSGPNNWKVAGYEITKPQQYLVLSAGSMVIFWLVGAGSILFWALGATVTVVALHAGFFDSEVIPEMQDPEQFPRLEEVV